MQITFSEIKTLVKKHLSVIGKRSFNKNGDNIFSNITLSTNEDPLLNLYIAEAMQNIESFMRQLVTSFSVDTDSVSISFVNTRGASSFEGRCREFVVTYATNYTISEYLAMTHPDLAAKYEKQSAFNMQSFMSYAYSKEPPETETPPSFNTTSNPLGIELGLPWDDTTITYTLGSDGVDDLIITSSDSSVVEVQKDHQSVNFYPLAAGTANVVLTFSSHPEVTQIVSVTVL